MQVLTVRVQVQVLGCQVQVLEIFTRVLLEYKYKYQVLQLWSLVDKTRGRLRCIDNRKVKNTTGKLILLGDFNLNDIDWDQGVAKTCFSNDFIETLRDNYLIQNVDSPTRARGTDIPHVLDLVVTNRDFVDDIDYMSPLGKSDHSVLSIKCNFHIEEQSINHKLDFEKGNYNAFKDFLNIDWEILLHTYKQDVESMWCFFRERILEGTNLFIPKVTDITTINKKWRRPLGVAIRNNIKNKSKLWKKYLTSKDKDIFEEYKKVRNEVRRQTREIIKEDHLKIAKDSKKNPKKFWNYVNSKTKSRDKIGDLEITNDKGQIKKLRDNQEKANVLCEYFSSVFNKDPCMEELLDIKQCSNEMDGIVIKEEDIIKRLNNLNVYKSAGPDSIHPRILKEAKEVLALPLKIIFNCSLETGVLPIDWKIANITPIFKRKGQKNKVNNYRPVSLTSVVCKVLESIIRDDIISHFNHNNIFSDKQYGFIKGRSTVTQLLKIMDEWTDYLESGGQIDVIYTDIEKAFDKVPHKILINKLKGYNINNPVIKWITSFLTNRKQRVRLQACFSEFADVLSGIPQGSILGPILFLIYINDLLDACTNDSALYVYADDAKLFKHVFNLNDTNSLQNDLNNICDWIKNAHLKLNTNKCKIISFGRKMNIDSKYYIDNVQLERVSFISDLGVIFDSQLNFNNHINEKIRKANSMLGIIRRNFGLVPQDVFLLLYCSLVRSHLEYANTVWNPHSKIAIEKLEKVQIRATKLVYSIKHLEYEERLKKLRLPTLRYRRLRGDLIEVYKIVTHYNEDVNCLFNFNCDYITRGNTFKLLQGRFRYDLRKHYFTNRITSIWNSLSDHVVSSSNINTFKNRLDKFMLGQDLIYNWKSDYRGAGSRSNRVDICDLLE